MEIYPMILEVFLRSGFKCTELGEESKFSDVFQRDREEFEKTLSAQQKKALDGVLIYSRLHWEDLHLNLVRNGIYFGVKLGMEIQHFLDTYDEE